MNYLSMLTEEEVHYICSVIPLQDSVYYFKKYPKDFAKIMPGFRATSIKSQERVSGVLFRNRNQRFISSFIEKHISRWIDEIQENVDKCIVDGDSKELAYIHTFPHSFFAGNVALYFKLIEDKHPEEYVALLTSVTIEIKDVTEKHEKLQRTLETQENDIEQLKKELNSVKLELKDAGIKLNERLAEIERLKQSVSQLEELRTVVQNAEAVTTSLKSKLQEREDTIQQLQADLTGAKDNCKQLEEQIRAEFEKQQAIKIAKQQVDQMAKCPCDIEEFKDYLGYNLENIGIPTNADFFALLKGHLGNILFQGVPVIINRFAGLLLMKCIANALTGHPNVQMLSFKDGILMDDVDCFLSSTERIVCLDNFIGNCNETELLVLLSGHKDKVIFLTVAYDGTLRYVSKEFLQYVHYLNLNRIEAFSAITELTEDPSTVEEINCILQGAIAHNRFSNLLRRILGEFGFPQGLLVQRCATVSDEQDLCRMMAFEILPYCVDVLEISPYNTSECFIKYAGNAGRCLYKNLFMEWFK